MLPGFWSHKSVRDVDMPSLAPSRSLVVFTALSPTHVMRSDPGAICDVFLGVCDLRLSKRCSIDDWTASSPFASTAG